MTKKAISPVVATALLLVVAVVAVVGFQGWFQSYQSGVNAKVETESKSGSAITIERLENGTVYIKNGGQSSVNVTSVKVSAKTGYTGSCTDATTFILAGNAVDERALTGCTLVEDSIYNVVVVTAKGVFSGELVAKK